MKQLAFIFVLLSVCAFSATLYRNSTSDVSGVDYGMMPVNSPVPGDVLSATATGAQWVSLTNFVRVWSGTTGGVNVPLANTVYLPPSNTQNSLPNADASGITRCPVTRATTLQNLYVVMNPGPGVGKTNTVTIMTNGVASSLSVNIVGAATNAADTTHTVTVPAGAEIGVRIVTASGGVAGKSAWSFEGR